jgi:hypothetical protein
MALPFFNPIVLDDGGIYDPDSGISWSLPPNQSNPNASSNITNPAAIQSSIAAARADIDRIKANLAKPNLGPKAKAAREKSLAEAQAELKTLQDQKKKITTAVVDKNPPKDETVEPTVYTAPDGRTFTDQQAYVDYLRYLSEQTRNTSNDAITAANQARSSQNAREFLIASLKPYFASAQDAGFLEQLTKVIDDYISQDYDIDTISVLLPQTDAYKTRFKGNTERANAGLSMLSPAEYIQAEEQYNEILKRFNLGDLSTRDTFATLIGGQVSAAELTDRVVNVYDRVRNADPALRAEIDRVEALGGGLTDADFAKALLMGNTGAEELKRKITTAEISAEARTRNLGVERAEELQRLGVTRAQARAGFEQIALTQPRLTQLSEMYTRETPEVTDLQTELEREQFQGLSSERRRRLAEQETAAFMGSSGTQGIGLRSRSRRGQI